MFDAIIIGRGPAGLTAATYLARANKKVLVIGKENKVWNKSVKITNYFGFKNITGKELMEKGEAQAEGFGAVIVDDLVVKIEYKNDFIIKANKEYSAKNLLIATGSPVKKTEIANEDDYVGKGVSYCVPCDGFFFKGKRVFVVGNTSYALAEAEDLLDFTNNVTIVTNGKKAEFETKKFKVENFKISKILGSSKVEAVLTDNGEIKVDGLFIASGDASTNDLAKMIGIIMEENKIKVDDDMKTNIPHIWAAGDCTKGLGQIITASAKGAVAAASILKEGFK